MKRFSDRRAAGRDLAQKLLRHKAESDTIVLGLPRGGVPVAYEAALALNVRLDIWIVRKLGLPGQEELAIGAVASGGVRILNHDIIQTVGLSKSTIDKVTEQELAELKRREQQYRGNRPLLDVHNHTVILIDDGLATGASMLAAVHGLRTQTPVRIIVAVPAASPQALEILRPEVDEAIFVIAPYEFKGVGNWYDDFSQITDEEVQQLLNEANSHLQP